MKQIFGYFLLISLSLVGGGCKRDKAPAPVAPQEPAAPKPVYEYGFNLLEYKLVKDTLREIPSVHCSIPMGFLPIR